VWVFEAHAFKEARMPHHRARFTALGRWDVARYVIEEGETFARAAARANVSTSTVWGWVARWRAASVEDQASLACLAERSSRPHRSPAQVDAVEAAGICALREKTGWSPRRLADEPQVDRPHSTVHQVLRRGGCSRRPTRWSTAPEPGERSITAPEANTKFRLYSTWKIE
jgi:transposase